MAEKKPASRSPLWKEPIGREESPEESEEEKTASDDQVRQALKTVTVVGDDEPALKRERPW
jgi:hypothetical protein